MNDLVILMRMNRPACTEYVPQIGPSESTIQRERLCLLINIEIDVLFLPGGGALERAAIESNDYDIASE